MTLPKQCVLLLSTILFSAGQAADSLGQSVAVYESTVVKTIEYVHQFHARVDQIGRAPNLIQKKRDLYNEMAEKLAAPAEFAHLPFPAADPERGWISDALKVARGLKPNINYLVKTGRGDSVICGSQAAMDNLYQNVRMIAWYHDQLDQACSGQGLNEGAQALSQLLDEYLSIFAKSIPSVKVKKSGRMNVARDHELEFSETRLWQVLSVINRYFFYKIQVHADRQDFYQADFMLMNSLIQTAALYGANPPLSSLRTLKMELSPAAPGWRGAAYQALGWWEKQLEDSSGYSQYVCVISIPAKPEPTKAPAKKAPEGFPSDVEDVKEVGGQIFIKRNGRWQPWDKK
jgi:hypothetical protein